MNSVANNDHFTLGTGRFESENGNWRAGGALNSTARPDFRACAGPQGAFSGAADTEHEPSLASVAFLQSEDPSNQFPLNVAWVRAGLGSWDLYNDTVNGDLIRRLSVGALLDIWNFAGRIGMESCI